MGNFGEGAGSTRPLARMIEVTLTFFFVKKRIYEFCLENFQGWGLENKPFYYYYYYFPLLLNGKQT